MRTLKIYSLSHFQIYNRGLLTSPFWRRSALGFLWKDWWLKLKLQYFGHLMRRVDSLEKTLMLGGIEGRRRRGRQDEMAGWHHRLDGYEFEWTLGVGDGQGGLARCDSWGCKESDTTEWLNWTVLNKDHWHQSFLFVIYLLLFPEPIACFSLFVLDYQCRNNIH